MKRLFLIMAFGFMFVYSSCDQANDETIVNDPVNDTESIPDGFLEYEEIPAEIEFNEADLIDIDADTNDPRKWCLWKVDTIVCPPGKQSKYKKGDLICYYCDNKGCSSDGPPPPGGVIAIGAGRNFSDGCLTYGKTFDTICKKRDNCKGTYWRK